MAALDDQAFRKGQCLYIPMYNWVRGMAVKTYRWQKFNGGMLKGYNLGDIVAVNYPNGDIQILDLDTDEFVRTFGYFGLYISVYTLLAGEWLTGSG